MINPGLISESFLNFLTCKINNKQKHLSAEIDNVRISLDFKFGAPKNKNATTSILTPSPGHTQGFQK